MSYFKKYSEGRKQVKKTMRIAALVMIGIMILTGCANSNSAKGSDNDEKVSEPTVSETVSGSVTLKQAIEKKGTQVWYLVAGEIGKDSRVSAVIVFENGNITVYDMQSMQIYELSNHLFQPYDLGKLTDYLSLSNADAIRLAEENYFQAQSQAEQDLRDRIEHSYEFEKDSPLYKDRADDRNASRLEAFQTVKDSKVGHVDSYKYLIVTVSDKTGNNTSYEGFIVEDYYTPPYYKGIDRRNEAAETTESGNTFFSMQLLSGTSISEIYDYHVGGFVAGDVHFNFFNEFPDGQNYFVTKCEPGASFSLDPIGTPGIIDDPEFSDEGKVITEPNP